MAGRGWNKRGYGCAVADGVCLAVGVQYRAAEHRLCVDYAQAGNLDDRKFVSDLVRALGRKPFWVSLSSALANECGDVKLCAIDDADGKLRGSELTQAMISQMQAIEANKTGDYVRTKAFFALNNRKKHVVGASVPQAAVNKTVELWSKHGVLNPCVGSLRAAVVNVFLALHPEARAADPTHRLLAYRAEDADYFCYLRNMALVDSGGSSGTDHGVDSLLDHLGAWGHEFAQKYQLTQNDGVRAYVIGSEPPAPETEEHAGENLEFWTVPWDTAVTFKTATVREDVFAHRKLAIPAFGLALHGV